MHAALPPKQINMNDHVHSFRRVSVTHYVYCEVLQCLTYSVSKEFWIVASYCFGSIHYTYPSSVGSMSLILFGCVIIY